MAAADRIEILDLRLETLVGVHPHERETKREVVLQLELETLSRVACETDDLEDALDYEAVCNRLEEHAGESRFALIESLAQSFAELLIAEFPLRRVRMRLEKPRAVRQARTVAFVLERTRDQGTETS